MIIFSSQANPACGFFGKKKPQARSACGFWFLNEKRSAHPRQTGIKIKIIPIIIVPVGYARCHLQLKSSSGVNSLIHAYLKTAGYVKRFLRKGKS